MNDELISIFGLVVTPWKLFGYIGGCLFAGRWLLQVVYSHLVGRPVLPMIFWLLSITGSLMLLVYFTFAKPDSVGFLSNLFPAIVSFYNLHLEIRYRRTRLPLVE